MPAEGVTDASLMGTVQRLTVSMEALAATGAHLRAQLEGIDVDPDLAVQLARVVEAVGAPAADLTEQQAALGFIRAFFRQAIDLLEHPGEPPGWSYDDPLVLQSIGRGSSSIADVIGAWAAGQEGLAARLAEPGATILDVGTGVGWLAIGLANRFPTAGVVGLDIWEPSLALARENIRRQGLEDRVEVRPGDAATTVYAERFDLEWLACPFLPVSVLPAAIAHGATALRPGGWMVLGLFGGPAGTLAALLSDLRTARAGGHPWTAAELTALAEAAGLADVHEVAKTWDVPLRIVVGRRT